MCKYNLSLVVETALPELVLLHTVSLHIRKGLCVLQSQPRKSCSREKKWHDYAIFYHNCRVYRVHWPQSGKKIRVFVFFPYGQFIYLIFILINWGLETLKIIMHRFFGKWGWVFSSWWLISIGTRLYLTHVAQGLRNKVRIIHSVWQ